MLTWKLPGLRLVSRSPRAATTLAARDLCPERAARDLHDGTRAFSLYLVEETKNKKGKFVLVVQ